MNVWICDDEKRIAEHFSSWIIEVAEEVKLPVIVKTFASGEELLAKSKEEFNDTSLILLDIEMAGIDGIATAKRLRSELLYQGTLLFLTNHSQVLTDCLDLGTEGRIQKNQSKETFQKEILSILKKVEQVQAEIFVKTSESNEQSFLIHELIRFFMTGFGKRKKLWLKTICGEYRIYESLDDLEERLQPYGFFRLTDQELLSLSNIQSFETGSVRMCDGSKIKISQKNKIQLTEQLFVLVNNSDEYD